MAATSGDFYALLAGVEARLNVADLLDRRPVRLMPTDPPDDREAPQPIDVMPVSSNETLEDGAPHSPDSSFLVAVEVRENRRDGAVALLVAAVDAIKNALLRDADFLAAYGPVTSVAVDFGFDEMGAKAFRGARLIFTFRRRTEYPPVLANDLRQVGAENAGIAGGTALIDLPQ